MICWRTWWGLWGEKGGRNQILLLNLWFVNVFLLLLFFFLLLLFFYFFFFFFFFFVVVVCCVVKFGGLSGACGERREDKINTQFVVWSCYSCYSSSSYYHSIFFFVCFVVACYVVKLDDNVIRFGGTCGERY